MSWRGDSDDTARQDGDGAAGGAATGDGTSTSVRMGVDLGGYSVSIHVDRSNKAVGDGNGVFVWKKSAMCHRFISL